MAFTRLLLTAALLPLTTITAHTQNKLDNIDDEIIVTGLRSVPISDVTSSVTILDLEALSIRNSPYIADQLRAVPSLGVSRSGAAGSLTQIRIRGAEANHTLVLLNGVEVSDPVTGETDFGLWSGLNTKRIEVARGEQSGLYGSDAIGGVISITTGGEGFTAAGEYGAFDTFRGQAGYQGQVEGLSYGISGAGLSTDGVDTSGSGGNRDGASSFSASANAALEFTPDVTLSAFTSFRRSETDFDSDTDFDGLLNDIDNHTEADQFIVAATLEAQSGPIHHLVRSNYTRVNLENFQDDIFGSETIGQRTKLSYSPSIDIGDDNQGITLSALAESENEDFERIDTDTTFGDPNQIANFNSFGLGGEIRGRLNGFAANASLRFDDNDNQFDNATTWRLGAAYNFTFGGKLRGSIGTGVKNPTFTELFGFFPDSFIGNPDLVPERSRSWEIGYDQSLGNFSGSITYFSAELEDEIFTSFTPSFLSSPANRESESDRSGIEVSANYQLNDAISLSGFASNIDSDDDNNNPEIRVPEWTASASVNWESQVKDGLRAGIAIDFIGDQDDFNFGTFPAQRINLDAYVLLSATAEYPVTDKLSLTLRGENLFDETVTDVFGSNQTGAGVFIGFKLR